MNTQEQAAFDEMVEALDVLKFRLRPSGEQDLTFVRERLLERVTYALSAAKAVSEPKLGAAVGELASPEYDQLRARVQPTAMPFIPWEMLESRAVQAQGEDKLRETVATVLEGWTIPDAVRKMLETAYWSHPQASEPAGCTWTQQDDEHMPGTWASSCGEMWSFIDGGPKDNRVSYCHHCGGKVNLAAPEATK